GIFARFLVTLPINDGVGLALARDNAQCHYISGVQVLPGGFAAPEHAADGSDNQADARQATDDVPPLAVGDQTWYPGKEQRAYNSQYTRDRTKRHAYEEHRQWENTLPIECLRIARKELCQVDEEEERRNRPDQC